MPLCGGLGRTVGGQRYEQPDFADLHHQHSTCRKQILSIAVRPYARPCRAAAPRESQLARPQYLLNNLFSAHIEFDQICLRSSAVIRAFALSCARVTCFFRQRRPEFEKLSVAHLLVCRIFGSEPIVLISYARPAKHLGTVSALHIVGIIAKTSENSEAPPGPNCLGFVIQKTIFVDEPLRQLLGKRVKVHAPSCGGAFNGLIGTVIAPHPIATGWCKLKLDSNPITPESDWTIAINNLIPLEDSDTELPVSEEPK
jgi:hypothetical protein